MLAPDAAIVLGIAATAIPFARTPQAQAERWLRVLRQHGEVGAALQALGVSEVSLPSAPAGVEPGPPGARRVAQGDVVADVTEHAVRIAGARDAVGVSTTDLLVAVMQVYEADFEHVLRAHGADPDELLELLGVRIPESVDN